MLYASLLALAALAQTVIAVVGPGAATGAYTGVHDPTLGKNAAGTYILVSTGSGLPIRTSTDRRAWTLAGSVFPNGAPSATDAYTGTTNGDLWAPDITWVSSRSAFILYFAASTFGSTNSAIFQATSPTGLTGTWTYVGKVISSSSSSGYNAIDPNLLIDGSTWYLQFGSWSAGIEQIKLSSSTGYTTSATPTLISGRPTGTKAEEAPFLYKYGSYYYLFTSFDVCCDGVSSTYNIRVSRSKSLSGPFADASGTLATAGGGTAVLATHDSIYGPGGQSVYTDTDGTLLVYHYYTKTGSNLGINLLNFSTGWPVVY